MEQTVIPQLRISDAKTSLPFYIDALGFKVDWRHQFEPGFPLFVQITRTGQTIFLTEHAGDCQIGGAVYFVVPDVDACAKQFRANGLTGFQDPAQTSWGTREMILVDPDGNRLRFASNEVS